MKQNGATTLGRSSPLIM